MAPGGVLLESLEVSTGATAVDDLLERSIACLEVTEIVGHSLSGKTQMCFTVCAQAAITGKAALYIDGALIGTDAVAATYLCGNRNGGLAQVWDEVPANPPGWSAEGAGANTMVSSAAIFAGQATAAVTS